MATLNKVFLMGNLTRDPELRYAPNGTAVTTFTVAMNHVYNSTAGEKKEDVCYVRVVCWAKLAQVCSEYLFKGRPVFVEGRLRSRSWQASDGTKRNTLEVIAQNVQFMGKGKSQDSSAKEDTAMGATEDFAAHENVEDFPLGAKQDEEVPF